VEREDFEIALSQIRPSALRETLISIPDVSWSDIGGLDEVKQRLENLLGRPVNTTLLFNSPTVERLMTHLTGEVLADVFGTDPVAAPARTPANDAANDDGALVDDLLSDLYRS